MFCNLYEYVKKSCSSCCATLCRFGKEGKALTCGVGAFCDQLLVTKEVDFILPPKPKLILNTSQIQSSPLCMETALNHDWKDGFRDPEESLRYLVAQHRKESCYVAALSEIENSEEEKFDKHRITR